MSLQEIANATDKSLSTIKRMSTKNPAALEKLVDSLLDGSYEHDKHDDEHSQDMPACLGTLEEMRLFS